MLGRRAPKMISLLLSEIYFNSSMGCFIWGERGSEVESLELLYFFVYIFAVRLLNKIREYFKTRESGLVLEISPVCVTVLSIWLDESWPALIICWLLKHPSYTVLTVCVCGEGWVLGCVITNSIDMYVCTCVGSVCTFCCLIGLFKWREGVHEYHY